MDGLELTQKIRQIKESQKLPILALTSDADAASNFLSEGVSDYLTKPFSRDEFYEKVYQSMGTLELL
jgi:putative two-component system response regulator